MYNDDDVLIAAAAFVIISSKKKRRKPRFWVRPSLRSRDKYSGSDLIGDLILDDVDLLNLEYRCNGGFRNFFRMSSREFETLLNMIGPKTCKQDTNFRKAIPVKERLALTLRFLATGDSYHSLMYLFKISKQVISKTIPEVCAALVDALQDYVKMPRSESDWKLIAQDYNNRWNFPNCVGAMDGKHIALQAPINSGSDFYNYKGYFSIVLFAVVDATYNFIYANVGCQGRISDGGVFKQTTYYTLLQDCKMNLPSDFVLPGRTSESPFVILADDAFPLIRNIMKPYPGIQEKNSKERIFNYRLSRGRRVSENVFGILSAVFRVLRKPLLLQPETATKVVLAVIYLHNFLRGSESRKIYNPTGTFDRECSDTGEITPGAWRKDNSETTSFTNLCRVPRKSSVDANRVRDEFKEYFSTTEGEVSWQYQMC